MSGVSPAQFPTKKKKVLPNNGGRNCCVCRRNDQFSRDLIFHTFPEKGKSFVNVKDDVSGHVVKKDRFTLWAEFAKISEDYTIGKFICSLHFKSEDYLPRPLGCDGSKLFQRLKNIAVPSIFNVEDNASPLFASFHQEQCDEMQTESVIRPPDMLCAIYSLPDANLAELDAQDNVSSAENYTSTTQGFNATEDEDNFYSRCLLCTCRPDVTPHLEIFSEAGNELKLAEKINKSLNIQIETELPQRVCQSCLEKLEVTHELVMSSQRARRMLLRMKQLGGSFDEVTPMEEEDFGNPCTVQAFEHVDIQHYKIKVEPDSLDSPSGSVSELDSYPPAMDCIDNTIDTQTNALFRDDSISSAGDIDQSVDDVADYSNKEPTRVTVTVSKSTRKRKARKPMLFESISDEEEMDGPSEGDFIKCDQCPQIIYRAYMGFHVKTHHSRKEITPIATRKRQPILTYSQRKEQLTQLVLGMTQCSFCKIELYNQVLDLHIALRHTQKTYQKTPELPDNDLSRLMQCPACPCMFFPEKMQDHIAVEHPPTPNPGLGKLMRCIYCHIKFGYHDMGEHLDSVHGPNAWTHCIHCRKRVRNTKTDMEVHLFQEHSGGMLLACRICDRRYSLTGKVQAHMQTFLSCKYKCPLQSCKKTFATLPSYRDHVLFYHPKIEQIMQDEIKAETHDILNCKTTQKPEEVSEIIRIEEIDQPCKRIIIEGQSCLLDYYPIQRRRHNYGSPVDCDICGQTVKHKWYLIQHKNKVHNMNLTWDCVDCGKKYTTMQRIIDHHHGVHIAKDHVCEICGEAFTKRRHTVHMKWHKRFPNGKEPRNLLDRPLDPVRCGMCNRPARNKYALLTHINAEHLDVVGERLPFNCEQCNNREFANYEYLMQHHYSVHLPKLVCNYCGKLITQNRMSIHLKLHEPDRGSNYKGRKRGRKPTKKVI